MPDDLGPAQVLAYLTPPRDSFWTWSIDGDAMVWVDTDATIAFRKELAAILERHVSLGLPPLGSIALMVLAARDSWTDVDLPARVRSPSKLLFPHEGSDWPHEVKRTMISREQATKFLADQLRPLDDLAKIPRELRVRLDVRAELSAMLFEHSSERLSPEISRSVVEALTVGFPREWTERELLPQPTVKRVIEDLKPLLPGLERFDADGFSIRFQTGVDAEVIPADVEEPLASRVRKLLGELQNDEELGGVAKLARNLLSMVTLPRPLVQPDEIPVGGVSDISNRGTLDKLLLSELAQDDEVLTMRVAMNEAMYLRRETPPRVPPRSRIVILDTGLRMWGVPRLMATSVAMSFAAMNESPVDLQVLVREGDHLFPSDFSTRENLIEHLKCLDPDVHPGRALGDLRKWLDEAEHETEVVLVTTPEVLADSEFQSCLKEFGADIDFLATVTRDGEFDLLQRMPRGTKPLRHAHLDVDALLAPATKPRLPLVDAESAPDLPAIFSLRNFPLRLSHNIVRQQSWAVANYGMLSITNDRRLMWWDEKDLAGLQITDRLHSRRFLWCATRANHGEVPFVVGSRYPANLQLGIVNLDFGGCQFFPLEAGRQHVYGVCEFLGTLFIVHRHEVVAFRMSDGSRLDTKPLPRGFRWREGRYFQKANEWKALATEAGRICFVDVPLSNHAVLAMFDTVGVSGPVAIATPDWNTFGVKVQNQYFPLPTIHSPVRLTKVIPGGSHVFLHGRVSPRDGQTENFLLHVKERTLFRFPANANEFVPPGCRPFLPRHHRNRITSVFAGRGNLVFKTTGDQILILGFDQDTNRFRITATRHTEAKCNWLDFHPMPGPPGVGYTLKKAAWEDGSQAVLDSRGLLHLKSSDPNIPEATFVLYDGNVAGWTSNGEIWGERYYTGRRTSVFPTDYFPDFVARLR